VNEKKINILKGTKNRQFMLANPCYNKGTKAIEIQKEEIP